MVCPWPEPEPQDIDAEKKMKIVQEAITAVRSIRGELNIAPTKPLPAIVKPLDEETDRIARENGHYISRLAHLSELTIDPDATRPKGSSVAVESTLEVYVPLEGLIDIEAELRRLRKELEGINKTLDQIDRKLMNEDFITKAPKEVVEKEKKRYNELMEKQKRLQENIERLDEVMR
jgi:valyl-tRNA synthetase